MDRPQRAEPATGLGFARQLTRLAGERYAHASTRGAIADTVEIVFRDATRCAVDQLKLDQRDGIGRVSAAIFTHEACGEDEYSVMATKDRDVDRG
jgi:hypothetical protein